MTSRIRILACLLVSALLCGCNHHEDDIQVTARKTVVVYMAAENSLSDFAESDLREMLLAKDSIPAGCNLVIYVDRTNMPEIYTITSSTGRELWKTLPEQDSCDSLTFRNTLSEIINRFPAQEYGLVMWSHGSGWIPSVRHKTIGVDNNMNSLVDTGNELEIPAMRRMLEQVGVHWDYIFFDACFMQCIEVAYELRHLCDYVIGSPAEIPGDGAPYHRIMGSMFAPEGAAAQGIVDSYFEWYRYGVGLVISAIRTDRMDQLALQMSSLVPQLFPRTQETGIHSSVQQYGAFDYRAGWHPEYYDMASVVNSRMDNPADYQQWWAQASQVFQSMHSTSTWLTAYSVINPRVVDPAHQACVSMFVPDSKYDAFGYNQALRNMQWYHAAGWDSAGW